MGRGIKPTRTQCDLLRRNGKFPDDYLYIGSRVDQEDYKNNKGNKKNLDRTSDKVEYLKFKNRAEGFVIELKAI